MVGEINDLRAHFPQEYRLSFLTLATLATFLVAIPIAGAWGLFLGFLYSPNMKHLLVFFLLFELIAIAVLTTDYLGTPRLFAQAKTDREQLQLAMTSGNLAAWEWDAASGRDQLGRRSVDPVRRPGRYVDRLSGRPFRLRTSGRSTGYRTGGCDCAQSTYVQTRISCRSCGWFGG